MVLDNVLGNTINLIDLLTGLGGGTSGGTSPNLSNILNPSAVSLLDLKASVLSGGSLVVVDGNVLQRAPNGSLIDVGLDIGGSTSNSPLVSVGGKIMAHGANGSLIDLNLGIGAGGAIIEVPPGGGPATPGAADLDVFRFYNVDTGVHFYTASAGERDAVLANYPQFQFEGNAFDVASNKDAGPEVFRFYNHDTGTHFYTASEAERDTVKATLSNYEYEGIAYTAYADDGGGTHEALYRFYNTETGAHFYTASETEVALTKQNLPQYHYDGIAYYVDAA